jgi:hypothetical protein
MDASWMRWRENHVRIHPDGMPVIDIPLDRYVVVGKKKPRRSAGASKGSLFDH